MRKRKLIRLNKSPFYSKTNQVSNNGSPRHQNIFCPIENRNFSLAEIIPPENELIQPDTSKLEKMIEKYNSSKSKQKLYPAIILPK